MYILCIDFCTIPNTLPHTIRYRTIPRFNLRHEFPEWDAHVGAKPSRASHQSCAMLTNVRWQKGRFRTGVEIRFPKLLRHICCLRIDSLARNVRSRMIGYGSKLTGSTARQHRRPPVRLLIHYSPHIVGAKLIRVAIYHIYKFILKLGSFRVLKPANQSIWLHVSIANVSRIPL